MLSTPLYQTQQSSVMVTHYKTTPDLNGRRISVHRKRQEYAYLQQWGAIALSFWPPWYNAQVMVVGVLSSKIMAGDRFSDDIFECIFLYAIYI